MSDIVVVHDYESEINPTGDVREYYIRINCKSDKDTITKELEENIDKNVILLKFDRNTRGYVKLGYIEDLVNDASEDYPDPDYPYYITKLIGTSTLCDGCSSMENNTLFLVCEQCSELVCHYSQPNELYSYDCSFPCSDCGKNTCMECYGIKNAGDWVCRRCMMIDPILSEM